jgi:hypothetical protein
MRWMSSKGLFYFCIVFLNLGILVRGEAQELEQTFIVSEQPYYQIGSNINYNLYLYNPEEGMEKVPSQTAYVELLDERGSVIFNHKHDVRSGSSPGQFETNDIDSTGWYWIRAYSYYQIGFCDELIHYIPVFLVHPEDIKDFQAKESTNPELPDFSIFIEGGKILEAVDNTIVVRSKSLNGTGKPLQAWIIDAQSGDSLKHFSIKPDGTGSCIIKGSPIINYSLLVSDGNNNSKVIKFPDPQAKKCNIRISDYPGSSQILLSLHFDESYDQYKNIEVFTKRKFIDQRLDRIRIKNKVENLTLDKNDLYPGENIIYVRSQDHGILGYKTIFINKTTENNLFILKDKMLYVTRQQLLVKVRMTNPIAAETPSALSVLVRDTRQFQEFVTGYPHSRDLPNTSYRNLSYHVGISSADSRESEQILRENYIINDLKGNPKLIYNQPIYPPEQELGLRGKVVDNKTEEPLSVRALTFTQTGERPGYSFQFTDREGNFEFDDIYFHNRNNELILNIGDDERIILDTLHLNPAYDPPPLIGNIWLNPTFLNFILARRLDQKFSKFYTTLNDSSQFEEADIYDNNKIYDKPDLSYDLDDYIQLSDMREVIIEILPNVKIFKLDGKTRIRIYHSANADMQPDPLFLVNGKIVKDNDFILGMDITQVKNIDVLVREAKLEYFGPVANGGIVAIYTKNPIDIPFGTRIDMAGFHQPRGIIQNGMPAERISNTLPGFDPVVYWNPVLKYEKNSETEFGFYFNDLMSDMEVIVQGINQSGEVFFDRKIVLIEKPVIN